MSASVGVDAETIARAIALNLMDTVESVRRQACAQLNRDSRSHLGQFMTLGSVATRMMDMLCAAGDVVRVLDPGAGVGSLTAALVSQILGRRGRPKAIHVTAYEIDGKLVRYLNEVLSQCREACRELGVQFESTIETTDFIADCREGERRLLELPQRRFDCVVMNPPYQKIHGQSATRRILRSMGIETSNLYSAFMLLAARRLAINGEFVSINPRSFCNGPYFRTFRAEFLQLISLRRIHLFESRSEAFGHDEVLQENVIVYGVRDARVPAHVCVSSSEANGSTVARRISYSHIVHTSDSDAVIHLPSDKAAAHSATKLASLPATLHDLQIDVSTGRVVDFRAKRYLRREPEPDTVPLIYPAHFGCGIIVWPNGQRRKPNAIAECPATDALLVPAAHYVLTKRFSAKEERRRIVAAVFDPGSVKCHRVGFDNKTNYFHRHGLGLPEKIAYGLAIFLNSTIVDEFFRTFSGHTQVNAADLRRLRYPSLAELELLAEICHEPSDQHAVDAAVASLVHDVK